MAQYADIIDVVAPAEAVAGSRVDITVKIKNLYSDAIGIMAGGALEYGVTPWPGIEFPTNWANVPAGQTQSFSGYFTMPDREVKIHAYSYWYGGGNWHLDDEMVKTVKVAEAVKGTITRKVLEYNETRGSIPVYAGVELEDRGLVHIWGRNDTGKTQRMGIYWFVADPDGYVVEEYTAWEAWPYTGAGSEHEFIGGRFNLSKAGRYTTWVELMMNPDSPQVVGQYIGALCDVTPAIAEFANVAITRYEKL
jgi:hypothetical protein